MRFRVPIFIAILTVSTSSMHVGLTTIGFIEEETTVIATEFPFYSRPEDPNNEESTTQHALDSEQNKLYLENLHFGHMPNILHIKGYI